MSGTHRSGTVNRHRLTHTPRDYLPDGDDVNSDDYSSYDNDTVTWDAGEPSGSASASEYPDDHRRHPRGATRRHTRSYHLQGLDYYTPPTTHDSMSDPSDEYTNFRGYGPQNHYGGQGGQGQGQYQNAYAPPFTGSRNQVVPYGNYPQGSYTPNGQFYNPNGYDSMVPFQQNFYGGHGYPMQQYYPPAPPTEHPGKSHTPSPADAKPNPEMEQLKKQLQLYEAEKQAEQEAKKQKLIMDATRLELRKQMEDQLEQERIKNEKQRKEMEKEKKEAERALREKLAAEKAAEEKAKKEHAAEMKRIEDETRAKFEAERKQAEEKAIKEKEAKEAAAAALKLQVAAEVRAAEEKKEKEAAKKKAEEEWRKKLQEEAKLKAEIEARAKLEEEKKKAEEAKAAEEEKKKAEKAMKERMLEEAKAKLEEQKKKAEKAPIKFKDAVGRKFNFPFHLCQTWQGMDELIKQAFQQVEPIGPHVQAGHFDLLGPDGEIILPSVWEKVIQPDWQITMNMWPMDKPPLPRAMGGIPGQFPGRHNIHPSGAIPGRGAIPMRPNMVPGGGAGPPRPVWVEPTRFPPGMQHMDHQQAHIVNADRPAKSGKKKSGSKNHSILSFIGGKQSKQKRRR